MHGDDNDESIKLIFLSSQAYIVTSACTVAQTSGKNGGVSPLPPIRETRRLNCSKFGQLIFRKICGIFF